MYARVDIATIKKLYGFDNQNIFYFSGSEALSPLSQLKRVDISGCSKLASIEAYAFRGCLDLKHVTISLNRALVYLDSQVFDPALSTLHSLNLADNGLQSLPASLVPWSRLHSLDLRNNPWHCDCALNFISDMLAQLKPNVTSDKIILGQCASPEAMRGHSLSNLKINFCNPQYHNNNKQIVDTKDDDLSDDNKVKNAFRERHEATNATAVIVSVSIVSAVIIGTVIIFIYLKCCRRKIQDWIKEYKWRRHDAAIARKTTLSQPYLSGDNYIYTSPRLHHTYVYHGVQEPQQHNSPLVNYPTIYTRAINQGLPNNELANTTDAEDEYFYVSAYGPNNTAVVMTNGLGTVNGKSIPVTVL